MHLVKDENGNMVPHGHDHEHHHDHGHCGNCQGGDCKNETLALLTYMQQHNEQHEIGNGRGCEDDKGSSC